MSSRRRKATCHAVAFAKSGLRDPYVEKIHRFLNMRERVSGSFSNVHNDLIYYRMPFCTKI